MQNFIFIIFIHVVVRKCGIKQNDLQNKPKLSELLPKFVQWIQDVNKEVSTQLMKQHFPGQ